MVDVRKAHHHPERRERREEKRRRGQGYGRYQPIQGRYEHVLVQSGSTEY
jgi:hypothetical protein